MGFFFVEQKRANNDLRGLTPDFLRRHECAVCPLNEAHLLHPKMLPTGSKNPLVYCVGEAPGKNEDEQGKQFVGASGKVIRFRIPQEWDDKIRWTNAIRCRPPDNRTPTDIELSCCQPFLERDVLTTKPKAIFGFGAVPLSRFLQQSAIGIWRGRRVPINVGGHACWYYPMWHPSFILHKRKFVPRDVDQYGSDDEFAFALDLQNAFAEIDSLPVPIIHSEQQASANIEIVDDVDRARELIEIVCNDPSVGFDWETNCLRPYSDGAKILSAGFSGRSNTFSFALDHSQSTWSKNERKEIDRLVETFLYEAVGRKVSHHSPFEMEWAGYFYGRECLYAGRWDDSESQAYVLDARRGGLSLDFLCLQYFGLHLKAISNLDRKNLDKTPLKQVLLYNGIDARYHRLLYLAQAKRVKNEGLQDVYEHQMRRIPSLVLAQMQGVPIDLTVVAKLRGKYEAKKEAAEKAIQEEDVVKEFEEQKGRVFNPASNPDVNYLVNEILKVDTESADKEQLSHVNHPIAKKIVTLREASKVLSTYIYSVDKGSENLYNDGMLHPVISTTAVRTWRTGSEAPNIQNWPKRDEGAKEVREQIRHPNMMVVSFDYAGIQARGVAQESLDKTLIDHFWHDYDVHADWLERIRKHYPQWVSAAQLKDKNTFKKHRHLSKNKFVFPTFFGAQSYTTSTGLGIPENIAEDLRLEFFDEFPGIKKWHEHLHDFYYENGYVTGLSGFRRFAPVSGNELINTPIQSNEAIIVLDAMARLSELQDDRYQAMFEVHDDISFLWPKNEIDERSEVVIDAMVNTPFAWAHCVPIEVEMSVGSDWLNMKEVGKFKSTKERQGFVEIK